MIMVMVLLSDRLRGHCTGDMELLIKDNKKYPFETTPYSELTTECVKYPNQDCVTLYNVWIESKIALV